MRKPRLILPKNESSFFLFAFVLVFSGLPFVSRLGDGDGDRMGDGDAEGCTVGDGLATALTFGVDDYAGQNLNVKRATAASARSSC